MCKINTKYIFVKNPLLNEYISLLIFSLLHFYLSFLYFFWIYSSWTLKWGVICLCLEKFFLLLKSGCQVLGLTLKVRECQYYQKQKETKLKIHYKLLPKKVYVFLMQVLSPLVNLIKNNILMKIEDYQWLCDRL